MNNKLPGIPDLHDGQLIGVLSSGRSAAVQATALDGCTWTLLLKGILRLRVADMYEGNIIFDCEVMETSSGAEAALEELVRGRQRDTDVQQWKDKLDDGSHKLIVITPSYGATVIALTESIEVIQGHAFLNDTTA